MNRIEEEPIREEPEIKDDYDLFVLGSDIYSDTEELNRDYTLAWTNKGIEDWIIKQQVLAKEAYEIVASIDKEGGKKIYQMLLQEMQSRLVMTRSRDGRVLGSMLRRGGGGATASTRQEEEKVGILRRLVRDKKEATREEDD